VLKRETLQDVFHGHSLLMPINDIPKLAIVPAYNEDPAAMRETD